MPERFDITETPLSGLTLVGRKQRRDDRGYLERLYDAEDLGELVGRIMQINRTLTHTSGAVRGMHFQLPPYAERKLVCCLRGSVFDVAIDVRRGSPTFLHWYASILNAENGQCLLIPEGFAHGFQTLTENCEMLYFHTKTYQPAYERGVHPEDPRVGITWPRSVIGLSSRDAAHPLLSDAFEGIET